MNEKYQYYFENGLAKQAILGEGNFYKPEITWYTEHDIGFVLDQFMKWAEMTRREEEAAKIIEETLPLFFEKQDLLFAVRSIWGLVLLRSQYNAGPSIPINMEKIGQVILKLCMEKPEVINQNDELRGLIEYICKYEPIIAKVLGVDTTKLTIPDLAP